MPPLRPIHQVVKVIPSPDARFWGMFRRISSLVHAISPVHLCTSFLDLPDVVVQFADQNYAKYRPADVLYDADGCFAFERTPPEITLYDRSEVRLEFAFAHEFGHYVDRLLHGGGKFASISMTYVDHEVRAWWNTVTNSAQYGKLETIRDDFAIDSKDYGFIAYFLDAPELFARSYAQYLAVTTQNPELLDGLRYFQAQRVYVPSAPRFAIQWQDADFQNIERAMSAILRRLRTE